MENRSNMSRRTFVKAGGAGILGASILGLAGCGNSGSGSNGDSTKFKLGVSACLTGAAAVYGTAHRNGAEIAIKELESKGGKVQFEANYQDDEGDPEKSVNAYNNLKDWGMQILAGPTLTGCATAVSSDTNSDNMFQFVPAASSVEVVGGDDSSTPRKKNVFQMCFTDPNQGTASAQYIKQKSLGTKIAIIYNNSDAYSTGIYNKFQAEATNQGLEIVSTTTFTDDSATDFSTQVAAAKDAGADLIFLPIYYTPIARILEACHNVNYTPKFFSCDGADGILTLEGFDTTLAEGVMLLTPFAADATDDLTKNFVKAYQDAYNGDTPNQFAADAYDVVMVLAQAIEKAGITVDMDASDICDKLVETITASDFTYSGLTGKNVTWGDNGQVSKQPKGMVIQNGAYVGLDKE